jgi:CheY-like chemotaxis protein
VDCRKELNEFMTAARALEEKLLGCLLHVILSLPPALQAAASFCPDVVLLDIGLPKMNGYEVALHIRKQRWGEPMALIAISGWGQEEDKRRALESGFDHHVTKPVEPTALEKLLALIGPVGTRE